MSRPNGVILYHGPSQIDGSQIVVILTGLRSGSANLKTGAMLQTWILRADRSPVLAAKDGSDAAICGACPHRTTINPQTGKTERGCYVIVHNAPRSVWACWKRGGYEFATDEDRQVIRSSLLRLGSYGDPAAVPAEVWQGIMSDRRTGYTHQWRESFAQSLQSFTMASVDSPEEAREAQDLGWRTFRIRQAGDPLLAREIVCPASEEAGKVRTCSTCKACAGNPNGRGASVAIIAHGSGAKHTRRAARLPVVA